MGYDTVSLFSGAMGLDLGLERAGLEIRVALELDADACATIRLNRPWLPLIEGDAWDYAAEEILARAGLAPGEVFLVCGGPPCQAFSTIGSRGGLGDERGSALLRFVGLVLEIRPKYFLLENVRGLLSMPLDYRPPGAPDGHVVEGMPGGALLHVLDLLAAGGYTATFALYDASYYGSPQRRERVIILGGLGEHPVPLIPPTHSDNARSGLPRPRTLRDAIWDLRGTEMSFRPYSAKQLAFYRMLKAGQDWRDLPPEVQEEAMGAAYFADNGGRTSYFRRLAWDRPCSTLVTDPTGLATGLCHPDEDRPLSVEEYKRVQEFPDGWELAGGMASRYRQLGNAVPLSLAEAAGRHLLWFDALPEEAQAALKTIQPGAEYSRYKETTHEHFERLRAGSNQLQLFGGDGGCGVGVRRG